MSQLKKLAGQTLWYGMSTIVARFFNYLLTPYLTYKFTESAYGQMSILYAFIPFMNVVFTYGMETSYFRYSNRVASDSVYNTASISLIFSSFLLSGLLLLMFEPLSKLLQIAADPTYFLMITLIIMFDALTTIPFAKLRQDSRPIKFASIKIVGVLVNVLSIFFFLSVLPRLSVSGGLFLNLYNPQWYVGYVLLANLIQSLLTFILLFKEFLGFKFQFDFKLWREMFLYSIPLLIAGFGGMINETFDRIMLGWWAPVRTVTQAQAQVGIYSACYKISILITLSVQAFRMGAEPFFFKQTKREDAPQIYARVMKFFVIVICMMFLFVTLYLYIWKYFIRNTNMWVGLSVVPILLFANMFLGMYYNLSISYKITGKTSVGAWITIVGSIITLGINYFFIPYYSYMACAWATFACYGSMMVISYWWGQRHFFIPYPVGRIVLYLVLSFGLFYIHEYLHLLVDHFIKRLLLSSIFFITFMVVVLFIERDEWFTLISRNKKAQR
ncbi:MAG: oligosaccharide flippase family protein [Phycisphaerales bacterium]|nr:oligosaccharide flippase family protein [Phycisphaerales bacterium]